MLTVVNDDAATRDGCLIDEIVRDGARRMPAAALEAEVNQYIAELAAERDERGHRMVVRNGRHLARTVVTAAGPVEVAAPRVNDRRVDEATGERKQLSSRFWPRGAGSPRRSARCYRCSTDAVAGGRGEGEGPAGAEVAGHGPAAAAGPVAPEHRFSLGPAAVKRLDLLGQSHADEAR